MVNNNNKPLMGQQNVHINIIVEWKGHKHDQEIILPGNHRAKRTSRTKTGKFRSYENRNIVVL